MKCFLLLSALLLIAPAARGQWVPTSDFTVASATAFAGDDQALYGVSGGRLYSIDPASYSWSLIPSSPIEINTVAKVGYYLFVATINYDLYESVNSGGTWTHCKSGTTNLEANWVVASNGTVYAGTNGEGVYVSSDNGSTWTASNTGLTALNINCLFATGSTVLAGTPFGVFASSNSGMSWSGTAALSDHFISRVATDGSILYEGNDEGVNGGLFYSLDNGGSWQRADAGLPNKNIHALATTSRGVYAGTDSGLYFSPNRGANWSAIKSGMEGAWIYAIDQLGQFGDYYLFVGTSVGAFVSTDNGKSWAPSSIGVSVGVSSVGDLKVNGRMLIAASGLNDDDPSSGVFQSSNGGLTWTGTSAGLPYNRAISSVAAEDSFLFAGSDSGICVSTNQGLSWSPSDSGFYNFLAVTALATVRSNVFAVRGNFHGPYSVLRSTNNGGSWREEGPPVVNDDIDFIASIGDKLFVGTDGDPKGHLYLSTDSGEHWKSITDAFPNYAYNGCTQVGSNLYVAAYNTRTHILRTSDDGANWDTIATGIIVDSNWWPTAFLSYDSALILGNGDGVFFTKDEGVHWSRANQGLYDSTIQTLAIQGSSLFAGTFGGGIFKRSIPEMLGSLDVAIPAKSKSSIQSYPNPFTHTTTLQFTSPASGYAVITIVNQLGAEVARMFAGDIGAGEHSFPITIPAGLAAGMYECIIHCGGRTKNIPIVVEQ